MIFSTFIALIVFSPVDKREQKMLIVKEKTIKPLRYEDFVELSHLRLRSNK